MEVYRSVARNSVVRGQSVNFHRLGLALCGVTAVLLLSKIYAQHEWSSTVVCTVRGMGQWNQLQFSTGQLWKSQLASKLPSAEYSDLLHVLFYEACEKMYHRSFDEMVKFGWFLPSTFQNSALSPDFPTVVFQTRAERTKLTDRNLCSFLSIRANPAMRHFEHYLLDDADGAAIMKSEFPEYLTMYQSMLRPVQRADILRYLNASIWWRVC